MSHIAIIPARGGSKRLPKKNIKLFCGKPLITWSVDAAIESNIFDEIVVSSDDDEILEIANCKDVLLRKRSSELSTDSATTQDVVADAISWMKTSGVEVSTFTILQPTSPLRRANHIIEAFQLFSEGINVDVVVSVSECPQPLEFINELKADLSMENFVNKREIKRSQELTKAYRLNGSIIIANVLLNNAFHKFYSERSIAYVMDDIDGVDIDTLDDFRMAECIMKMKGEKN
ncbi:acylneuraminate cytidylyltransferase family protein [Octadecabacter sp.]|nr:acylneuraminate cytidylyltransferase family protein [Octadecabacter sp.]